jgi:hypothetical protein
MYAFLRSVMLIVFALVAASLGYGVFRAMSGVYDYEFIVDDVYQEGCPYVAPNLYPFYGRGVRCQWRRRSYSGFSMGMTRAQMLKELCEGNQYGVYAPPLRVLSAPIRIEEFSETYARRANFNAFPCGDAGALRDFAKFQFTRRSSALELKRHVEIFVLTFENDQLREIELHRYTQFFPNIDFQRGETF